MITQRTWLEKLTLSDFRNYARASLDCGPEPVVLFGSNGAGKTNCLEAISLLSAGRGLRGRPFAELAREGGSGGWAVAATLFIGDREMKIGTGVQPAPDGSPSTSSSRTVKIDGAAVRGSGALAEIRMLWLTPAMDGLFTGPAADRRRFLDRLVLSFEPDYARPAAAYERAMRQRNRALEMQSPPQLVQGFEAQMAEAGVAMALARSRAIEALAMELGSSRDGGESAFPWGVIALAGGFESFAAEMEPEDAEAAYRRRLAEGRARDEAAGRTLVGPHRSDFEVTHGPKNTAARLCSTGEQKALLVGLILAQARLIRRLNEGLAPIMLLDEIAAHLDEERRFALFSAITDLEAQVFMTGTDAATFEPLRDMAGARFFLVSNGSFLPANSAESALKH